MLLHRRTEGLPAQLPRPVDVRQRAQRERRTRRAAGGAVAAVVAVVAGVTVMTGGGPGPDKPEPVVSPTPQPTASGSGPVALRVTRLMTASDWERLVGQRAVRLSDHAGIGCAVDRPDAAVEHDGD